MPRGRREARRVLVDVVRRVEEVRDPRPRQAGQRVEVERVAVVVVQQLRVGLGQDLRRDRLILLGEPMRAQLVVGEQHLRVEGAGDVVDRVLEQHDPLDRIGRSRQHVLEQQRLAQRGRHLRDEDRVVRVDERLGLVRQDGVHRVTHLVRRREHVVERVGVVQQHVRVRAVHRRRVRARALAFVLVDVDPAALEALAQPLLVVRPERRDRRPRSSRARRRTGTSCRTRRAGWRSRRPGTYGSLSSRRRSW